MSCTLMEKLFMEMSIGWRELFMDVILQADQKLSMCMESGEP